jgi:small-conductance mechanosensitive channel
MKELTTWSELFMNSLQTFGQKLMGAIPSLLAAIAILLIGWLLAKLISSGISKLLKLVKFDTLSEKVKFTEFLSRANVSLTPSGLIGKFVYWLLLLLVIISASDALGWNAVSNEISKLLSYLPNLLIAIVFFVVGTYIASFVRDLIQGAASSLGISTGKLISSVVFYLLFIIVTLTALDQAGVDTTIITSNLLLFLGAILAAAAISYGIASKDVLSNILASFFSRRNFKVGQIIEVDGIKGEIISINNISVTIQDNNKEKIIVPSHILITNKVKVSN